MQAKASMFFGVLGRGFCQGRGVAQLGLERCVRDAEVAGSNPVAPTNAKDRSFGPVFCVGGRRPDLNRRQGPRAPRAGPSRVHDAAQPRRRAAKSSRPDQRQRPVPRAGLSRWGRRPELNQRQARERKRTGHRSFTTRRSRGAAQRNPVAPTNLQESPFGERVEGLSCAGRAGGVLWVAACRRQAPDAASLPGFAGGSMRLTRPFSWGIVWGMGRVCGSLSGARPRARPVPRSGEGDAVGMAP